MTYERADVLNWSQQPSWTELGSAVVLGSQHGISLAPGNHSLLQPSQLCCTVDRQNFSPREATLIRSA